MSEVIEFTHSLLEFHSRMQFLHLIESELFSTQNLAEAPKILRV